MEILGEIFGQQDKIKAVNEFYISKFELVKNRFADNQKNLKKPKVYVEFSQKEGPEVFGTTYDDKMWGAFINLAGGDNIAKGLIKGTSATINPEFIVAKNPDIIIFAGNYFKDSFNNIPLGYGINKEQAALNYEKYTQRPGWSNLNAIKKGNVFAYITI